MVIICFASSLIFTRLPQYLSGWDFRDSSQISQWTLTLTVVHFLSELRAFTVPRFPSVALSLSVLETPSVCLSAPAAASLTLNARKWFLTACHSPSSYYSLSIYQDAFPDSVTAQPHVSPSLHSAVRNAMQSLSFLFSFCLSF